jgi:hypothetical protein
LKNPFVTPVSQLERVKAAQVCPYCFAQVYTIWGQDLRVRGRCPECKRRVYRFKSVMHSRRDMLLFLGTYVAVALAVASALVSQVYFT